MNIHQVVGSSQISAIGYNPESKVLVVQFNSSWGFYQYIQVPEDVYASFMQAESKGSFFSSDIRGKFKYSKVQEAEVAAL